MLSIVIFFVILLALVIIHEFGHYIVAKKNGIRVEEFGFGLPPRIFGRKFGKAPVKGEDDRTLFSLNLLPIGGFVRLSGEDATFVDPTDKKNFQNAALWKRMAVVLAGVTMNFILGILLFGIVYTAVGIPENVRVLIQDISPGSPAEKAGLLVGDRVSELNATKIKTVGQMQQLIAKNADREIAVNIVRSGEAKQFMIKPEKRTVDGQERTLIGVGLEQKVDLNTSYPFYEKPIRGAVVGLSDTVEMAKAIVPALADLGGSLLFKQKVPAGVSGPKGIYDASKVLCGDGLYTCLQFAGLLSINLAVFNLLPIPALDGGRFMFMVYEAITRRKPNPKIEQWSHAVGFALLIVLIIVITFNDIFTKGASPFAR